jgi:hypothetical protein
MGVFSAQVSKWAAKSEKRVEAVFKQATQDVAEQVKKPVSQGGNMRVDTGFLRASLMASTAHMPRINKDAKPSPGQTYNGGDSEIALVIAGAEIKDTIYLGFTASYAAPREYHDGFVRLTAQNWPKIVDNAARVIKSRVG